MIEFILALIFIEKVDEVMLPSNVGMMHDRFVFALIIMEKVYEQMCSIPLRMYDNSYVHRLGTMPDHHRLDL